MADTTMLIRPPSSQAQYTGRRNFQAQGQTVASHTNSFASLMAEQQSPRATSNGGGRAFVLAGRTPSDLMRMQTFNSTDLNLRQAQATDTLMQSVARSDSTLELARSMGTARHLQTITGGNVHQFNNVGSLGLGDFVHACPTSKRNNRSKKKTARKMPERDGLGMLSARFESGKDGIAAIGYDRTGGTSYGKYQIASRVGSMRCFLNFLSELAPDLAKRLSKAGPANTGSRYGAMPDVWRAIAKEQPERFEALQEAFIRETHYKPALDAIVARTNLDEDRLSAAMSEVIWSTAVQHGPIGAARIFERAEELSGSPNNPNYERNLISNVYKLRAGQFGSSSSAVRAAVQNRFKQEKALALNMLGGNINNDLA